MLGSLAATLTLTAGLVADESKAPAVTSALAAEVAATWGELESPWYEVRSEAERRLRHLPVEDGRQVAAVLAGAESPALRRAYAEWVRFRFERPGATPVGRFERDRLVERLLAEEDPSVVDRLIHAAACDGEVVRRLGEAREAGGLDPAVHDRVLGARLVRLLEDVMHQGRVPGFFDGQFTALFELHESAYERLLSAAHDPRVHYVIRALSIMALHEARRPSLEVELAPLLVPPDREYEWPDALFRRPRIDTDDVQDYCACKLSQYARFSCAKAGQPRPIKEKIRTLESIAARRLGWAEELKPSLQRSLGEDQLSRLLDQIEDAYLRRLEDAMDAYFELGYHYQQLDDYVRAELEYRTITERPEALRTKSWAYYNLACIRAVQGRTEQAIAEMERAVDSGFTDASWARRDGDLESLRGDPRFHRILRRAEGREAP